MKMPDFLDRDDYYIKFSSLQGIVLLQSLKCFVKSKINDYM